MAAPAPLPRRRRKQHQPKEGKREGTTTHEEKATPPCIWTFGRFCGACCVHVETLLFCSPMCLCELKFDDDRAWNVLSRACFGEEGIERFVSPIVGLVAECSLSSPRVLGSRSLAVFFTGSWVPFPGCFPFLSIIIQLFGHCSSLDSCPFFSLVPVVVGERIWHRRHSFPSPLSVFFLNHATRLLSECQTTPQHV